MVGIGKLRAGQEDYYLASVATGYEDYYVNGREVAGRWQGKQAEVLGLIGEVQAEDLTAMMTGHHPRTGESLIGRRAKDRVAAWDITIRAPKSVSLYAEVAWDEGIRRTVRRVHAEVVERTLAWIEREAAYVRRGKGGVIEEKIAGLITASFRHGVSRANEPALHTHQLVMNLGRSENGRWYALDGRRLYGVLRTAGFLYQSELRARLTEELGVEWSPVVNGAADIAGVPREVIEAFSTRRREIEAAVERIAREQAPDDPERQAAIRGSAKTYQKAALETRRAKRYRQSVPGEDLGEPDASTAGPEQRAEWQRRAVALGWGPGEQASNLARRYEIAGLDLAAVERLLKRVDGIRPGHAQFSRLDLIQRIAESGDARLEDAIALADELIAHSPEVLRSDADVVMRDEKAAITLGEGPRAGQRVAGIAYGQEVLATRAAVRLEEAGIAAARGRREAGVLVAGQVMVDAAVAASAEQGVELGADQREGLARITQSRQGVNVVVGRPGTGKTAMLAPAKEVWRQQGASVIGLAVAAKTARRLEASTGISSGTIARFLLRLGGEGGAPHPPGQGVWVVDEAGMVETQDMVGLIEASERYKARLVLVGDPAQLPPVGAGGMFPRLADELGRAELTVNRRQKDPEERQALDWLRQGEAERAFRWYLDKDRVTVSDDHGRLLHQVASAWRRDQAEGKDSLMVAYRNADVFELNLRARSYKIGQGELGEVVAAADGVEYRERERVIARRNEYGLGVFNGIGATVVGAGAEPGSLLVARDDGIRQQWDAAYVAEHVQWGYASTVHQSQGLTCDTAHYLTDPDSVRRELAYVALSRGRESNRAYLSTGTPSEDLDQEHLRDAPDVPDTAEDSTTRFCRHLAETMAKVPAVASRPAGRRDHPVARGHPEPEREDGPVMAR